MVLKRIHALYLGTKTEHFLPGWGYDLEMSELDGNVTFCQAGSPATQQVVSKESFQKRWRIIRSDEL